MVVDIINERLKAYHPKTKQSEFNAIKEISQEIALAGLSRAGFFKHAVFQGGTCLRIIHGLNRFSEDLDFMLNEPNMAFSWGAYLSAIKTEFEAFGLSLSIIDRTNASDALKKAFLKENSFGKVLNLQYERTRADTQHINIKLEIDTNPPEGSVSEAHILEYPYPLTILSQDLPSLFAGKCHALLCRKYVKGRDWYDFIWYIQHKIQPNYTLLKNALYQHGSYQGVNIDISRDWLQKTLSEKISELAWSDVANDVKNFLPANTLHSVEAWSKELFLGLLKKLP